MMSFVTEIRVVQNKDQFFRVDKEKERLSDVTWWHTVFNAGCMVESLLEEENWIKNHVGR